tara:strand:- start:98 stop:595 length:498 start_codon:yes stop_codon:yes gene_type:complete
MSDNEFQEVNMNAMHHSASSSESQSNSTPDDVQATDDVDSTDQTPNISYEGLSEVMNVLFSSSKEVLGNITSIGVKFGGNLSNPNHMLVVFPNEMFGFESWNNAQKKCRWRYSKTTTALQRNGVDVPVDASDSFVSFVQNGLMAVQENQAEFSKNITKDELKSIR